MFQTYLDVAMIVFGGLSLYAAFAGYRTTRRLLGTAVEATGTITEIVETSDDSVGYTYTPHFIFQTREGLPGKGHFYLSSSRYSYKVGGKIPLLYDPADPTNVSVHKATQLWGPSIAFGLIGLLLLGTGVWLLHQK